MSCCSDSVPILRKCWVHWGFLISAQISVLPHAASSSAASSCSFFCQHASWLFWWCLFWLYSSSSFWTSKKSPSLSQTAASYPSLSTSSLSLPRLWSCFYRFAFLMCYNHIYKIRFCQGSECDLLVFSSTFYQIWSWSLPFQILLYCFDSSTFHWKTVFISISCQLQLTFRLLCRTSESLQSSACLFPPFLWRSSGVCASHKTSCESCLCLSSRSPCSSCFS